MAERRELASLVPDIIPMAGVALLIVLMLMMTAPQLLTHESTPVDVPYANTVERQTEENYTIALLPDHSLKLNDRSATKEEIEKALTDKLAEDPYFLVVIRADRRVPEEWVMDLLAMARKAGAQRVAVATKPKKKVGVK